MRLEQLIALYVTKVRETERAEKGARDAIRQHEDLQREVAGLEKKILALPPPAPGKNHLSVIDKTLITINYDDQPSLSLTEVQLLSGEEYRK